MAKATAYPKLLFTSIGVFFALYFGLGSVFAGTQPSRDFDPFTLDLLKEWLVYIFVKLYFWPLWLIFGHPTIATGFLLPLFGRRQVNFLPSDRRDRRMRLWRKEEFIP